MKDLIEALTIFAKYTDDAHPTSCEHDELMVCVDPKLVSTEDLARLAELSFSPHAGDYFYSFRFGSC